MQTKRQTKMMYIEAVLKVAMEKPLILLGADQKGAPLICTLEAYMALGGRGGVAIDVETASRIGASLPATLDEIQLTH